MNSIFSSRQSQRARDGPGISRPNLLSLVPSKYIGNSDAIVAILYIYISPTHQSWRARDIPSRPAISRSRPEDGKRKPGPVPYAEIATRAHPIPRRFDPGPSHYTLFQTRPGPDPVPCPGRDNPGWDFPDPVVSLSHPIDPDCVVARETSPLSYSLTARSAVAKHPQVCTKGRGWAARSAVAQLQPA